MAFGLIGNGEYAARPASLRAEGGDCGGGSEFLVAGTLNANGKAAGSATSQDAEAGLLVTHTLRAEGFDASEDGTGRGIPLVPVAVDLRNGTAGDIAMSIQAGGMGDDRGLCPNAVPHTLRGASVRRLTPRECERLQGFPDDYTLVHYRNKPAADGPRYKALGNSMAVPVMAWLGRRIEAVEAVINARSIAA